MTEVASITDNHPERTRDILLLGPPGHGKTTLGRALRGLMPPHEGEAGAPAAYYEVTEIWAGGVLLRLWDCAPEDWYRLALCDAPRGGALLVFSPTAEIGPETGEVIEAQLSLLRELGETPLVVFMNGLSRSEDAAEAAQLARAERAVRDLAASEDPAEEVPILRGAAAAALAGDEVERGALRALGEQLARTSPAPRVSGGAAARLDLTAWIVVLERDGAFVLSPGLPLLCRCRGIEVPARLMDAAAWGDLGYGEAIQVRLSLAEPLVLDRLDHIELLEGGCVIAAGVVTDL